MNNTTGKKSTSKLSPANFLVVQRRFDALKHIQLKIACLEAQFYEDLYLLECKYSHLARPLYTQRRRIVSGEHEPTEAECLPPPPTTTTTQAAREREQDFHVLRVIEYNPGKLVRGVPDFWLSVLKRVGLVSRLIAPIDEPVLKYLYDVEVNLSDQKPYSFCLLFHFWPNKFFVNPTLIKTYRFRIEQPPGSGRALVFEAPESECSQGCHISWKERPEGHDEDAYDKAPRSFFNFFDRFPFEKKPRQQLDCVEEAQVALDCEIGFTFKEKLVPNAVLYYLGEISDEEEEEEEDECDDGTDDESDGSVCEAQKQLKRKQASCFPN